MEEAQLNLCESFRVDAFNAVIDVLSSDTDKRAKTRSEVIFFGFLRNLPDMEPREMRQAVGKNLENVLIGCG